MKCDVFFLEYSCLDLDDTLYPLSSGLATSVLKNIQRMYAASLSTPISTVIAHHVQMLFFLDYMVENLGIEESKIPSLCELLYKNYGTTMAGLRVSIYTSFRLLSEHDFV